MALKEQEAETATVPAVIYAAKSTEDRHGSILSQLQGCREMAATSGWTVIGEYQDERFSAYSSNRGPGLERAKRAVREAAAEHGLCMLIAQHSDRFARGAGDAPGAADHLAELFFAMRRQGVRLRSVQDDSNLEDVIRAVLVGERNFEDSKRKSQATRDGKRRRWQRGQVNAPVHDGYARVPSFRDGETTYRREPDPTRAPVIRRIFDLLAAGRSPGDVARIFNAEGVLSKRGRPWSSRAVRRVATDPYYAGKHRGYGVVRDGDHAALVDLATWDRVQEKIARRSITARGGRTGNPAYILSGVLTCGQCGSKMYRRDLAAGRAYQCAQVRQSMGLCDAPKVPAQPVEEKVLDHLADIFVSIDRWIETSRAQRTGEREAMEAALSIERTALAQLDRDAAVVRDNYRSHLREEATSRADLALDELDRIERERGAQGERVQTLEGRLSTWTDDPDVDPVLDWVLEINAVIEGAKRESEEALALNAALRDLLEAIWVERSSDGGITLDFELHDRSRPAPIGVKVDGEPGLPRAVTPGPSPSCRSTL